MNTENRDSQPVVEEALTCGLVMPISTLDGCPAEHWLEVKSIITDAVHSIDEPRFAARLVSEADDVGVIQKRIVQGVYGKDIVVCDVSGKNPNVMFELGMRLAFDKPTVIIKDDKTDYSFDTGPIEHLTYPRDLRFSRMVDFKQQLASKVKATYLAWKKDPQEASLLKSFGTLKVAQLGEKEAPASEVLLALVTDLQREVQRLGRTLAPTSLRSVSTDRVAMRRLNELEVLEQAEALMMAGSEAELTQLIGMAPKLAELRSSDALTPRERKRLAEINDFLAVLAFGPSAGSRRNQLLEGAGG